MLVTIPALCTDNNRDGWRSPQTTTGACRRDIRAAALGQVAAPGLRCLLKFRPASANLEFRINQRRRHAHPSPMRCLGASREDYTRRGIQIMLWYQLRKGLLRSRLGGSRRPGLQAHTPGVPSDIPPLPPNREPPDIILPPRNPPTEPPDRLPPPPPPPREPPRAPPRIAGN